MSRRTPLIMVAPNGARHGKDAHPALPVTEEELVKTAVTCRAAGAQGIHIHVRDDEGRHVLDVARYDSAVRSIRRATDDRLLVQVTTEAVGRYSPQDIADVFERVEASAISVAMREFVPGEAEERLAAQTLGKAVARGKAIQHLIYSPQELERFIMLVERGVVPDDELDVLFVLGRYGGEDTDPASLIDYLDMFRASSIASKAEWSACAFGPPETRSLAAVLAMGGKARVGFENNFRNADEEIAADNAERVAAIVQIAKFLGRIKNNDEKVQKS